jgi:hypothetical protein
MQKRGFDARDASEDLSDPPVRQNILELVKLSLLFAPSSKSLRLFSNP